MRAIKHEAYQCISGIRQDLLKELSDTGGASKIYKLASLKSFSSKYFHLKSALVNASYLLIKYTGITF